jgi:ComF family protein
MKFCKECESKLKLFSGDVYIPNADGFSAAFEYNENIRHAVFLLKDGICGNAAYALGNSLAEKLISDNVGADMITFVPMFPKDRRKRSFNQSFLIAAEISAAMNIPVADDLIVKTRRTSQQKLLSGTERRVNLINAFSVINKGKIKGRNIILVDDICTTGSTLAEISSLLKANGASSVYCACCCKTKEI